MTEPTASAKAPVLEAIELVAGYIPEVNILNGCNLVVEEGEFVGIIGPNGAGKSTLLRALYRHLRPTSDAAAVGGDNLWELPAKENARRVAAVPQERSDEFDFTVREVVGMGRLPHQCVGFALR